jgi:methyl-accepting chemotaxis protein
MADIGMLTRAVKRISTFFNPTSPKERLEELHLAVRSLGELTGSTEEEFLSLGERLQQFNGRSKDISELSSSISAMMSGKETTEAIEGLRQILKRIKEMDEGSRQGTEIMRAILDKIEEMHRPLIGFARIVRNLRILCNFIKIESAYLECGDNEFHILSEDVGTLAAKIEFKSADLFDQSMRLSLLVKGNLSKIMAFEQSSHGQALFIVDGAFHCLNSLTEKHDHSAAMLKDVTIRWDRIARNIGDIVSSLQFHDITRQRIEHVKESLVEVTETQCEPQKKKELNGLKKNLFDFAGKDPSNGSGGLMVAVNACEIQRAQLDHARVDVVSAIERIIKDLQEIARHVEGMCEETGKLVNVTDESGASFISSLEKGFSALTGSIAEFHRIEKELLETIDHAAHTIVTISTFINDLEKIGIEIQMIGLNACIRAAHAGEKGAALGILADSIYQLSADTSHHTNIISEGLKMVIQSAEALTDNADRKTTADHAGQGLPEEDVARMMKPLHEVDEKILSLLNRVIEQGNTLSDDIAGACNGIQVHRQFDRGIENVNCMLDAFIANAKSILPAAAQQKKADVDGIKGRYTMRSERVVHQAVIGGAIAIGSSGIADSAAASETEQPIPGAEHVKSFTPSPYLPMLPERGIRQEDSVKKECAAAGGEDLGDNVELF